MQSVKVNGEILTNYADMSVLEFLQSRNYNLERVAVEKDGEILQKKLWESTKLSSGRTYEIVELVGGG